MQHPLITGLLIATTLTSGYASAQSQPQQAPLPYPPQPASVYSQPAYSQPYGTPSYATGYGYGSGYGTTPYAPYAAAPQTPPDSADSSDGSGLIIGGAITLGSFYLFSALSMAGLGMACDAKAPESLQNELSEDISMCAGGDPTLGYIPVAGPFVAIGELADSPVSVWPINVGLVALGLGQVVGAGLLIGGLAKGTGDDGALSVQPMVGPGGASLAVTRAF